MTAIGSFERALTGPERRTMGRLRSPGAIQAFLDGLRYSTGNAYRCPLRVLREGIGHCFDGALFAAAALIRIGRPASIVALLPSRRDDDHVLTLFRRDGHWGALAKSNFVGLRYREPVYRTLRELVLSYFEPYYNVARERTLRSYTLPLSLKSFDHLDWMTRDEPLDRISDRLDEIRRVSLLTPRMIARLGPVDERSYRAGLLGSTRAGLFRPPRKG